MSRGITVDEFREEQENMKTLRKEQKLGSALSALRLPEQEFIRHFRITKSAFQQLTEELLPYMMTSRRKTAVPNQLKILAALMFYAHGSYQKNIGLSDLLNVSQPTLSRCLRDVTNALNNPAVLRAHIKFPEALEEREAIMGKFMKKFGFPGIVGCVDGTHIALIKPTENEEAYLTRKQFHSLNAMIICDADLNIVYVDATSGGASKDSDVCDQSNIKEQMEKLTSRERCWLLGDSAYVQRPWMMTPIIDAAPRSPEEYYTNIHCEVRGTIDRCIGSLKARWRCLISRKVLHYDPVTCARIVNACAVLHNIANEADLPAPELPASVIEYDRKRQTYDAYKDVKDDVRDALVNRLWQARLNKVD